MRTKINKIKLRINKSIVLHSFLILFTFQLSFSQVDILYTDLVWSDEFDSNGAVNSNNWFHQTQLPAGGNWYNGEEQHYTNKISNSFIDGGFLNIVAKREILTDQGYTKNYTSARLNSKFAFKYGRVDVRAKLPIEQGTWPAIWTLGKNINEDGAYFDDMYGSVNWPACGEIDIMEHGITSSEPINFIQSAIHTPSSFGNTKDKGGVLASNLGNDFHVYSLNWSPFQISFLLDDVVYYTYKPDVKDANTWPFDAEQYLLLNIAMGGIAGQIEPTFNESSMVVDYVRIYQNTTPDTQAPTNFTASVGNVTSNSVELILEATDDSGSVVFSTEYGANSVNSSGLSNTAKTIKITGLLPNTNYNFSNTVRDLSGNESLNNPIVVNATTLEDSNLMCEGTSSEAQQGLFLVGYNYSFKTVGTDVEITFGLLDSTRIGVIAYLWEQMPFAESPMTNVSGNLFTKTITNQTIGSTINYAAKFAFAGGLAVTKYFSYVVGSSCTTSVENENETFILIYPNPTADFINISSISPIDKVEVFTTNGAKVMQVTTNTDNIDVRSLTPGIYLVKIISGNKIKVEKILIN